MDSQFRPWFPSFSLLSILKTLILISVPLCSTKPADEWYESCGATFNCGPFTGVGYPFHGSGHSEHCGYPNLELKCDQDRTDQIMDMIVTEKFTDEISPHYFVNTTVNSSLFKYISANMNISFFYDCPVRINLPGPSFLPCKNNSAREFSGAEDPGNCNISVLDPALQMDKVKPVKVTDFDGVLQQGFVISWKVDMNVCRKCTEPSGRCGYNFLTNQTTCFCDRPNGSDTDAKAAIASPPPGTHTKPRANGSSPSRKTRVVLPVTGGVLAGIGITWLICFCRQRRKRKAAAAAAQAAAQTENGDPHNASSQALITIPSTHVSRRIPSFTSSRSGSGKGSTCFGVKVFSYKELEEATDNFNDSKELGSGGYGIVYYGTLKDGQTVAVKRLYENNLTRGGQFLNEVEILNRLNHENLVKLYGCTSKKSREHLLVYEYIPNGTVADHIHGEKANSSLLSWPVRLNIAIETADALAYLHASDIIHRDVKTNNILLDHSFRVKVADFGLSKLFPNDATHISTGPRGTPGYLDPDYFKWFRLTEKSDIYSFGVVLIELVSSLQAVDPERPQDASLASLAITKIQNQKVNELVDISLGFETNSSVQKTTTLVAELAFRCLQEMYLRPSMKEVVEELRAIKIELDAQKVGEKLDVPVDGCTSLEGKCPSARSPDSVTAKWISVSTVYSSY